MFSLPLYVFLFIYLAFAAVCAAFFLLILYNLAHSASLTLVSFVATMLVLSILVCNVGATWYVLHGVIWADPAFVLSISSLFSF